MSTKDEESEILQLALRAFREATERHKQAGRPIVFVRRGQLIESINGVETVLGTVPAKVKAKLKKSSTKTQPETATQ